jgi:hypothetical protein
LLPLYQRMNEAIEYPDGMRTSHGIIYLGHMEHYPALGDSILGIQKFIGGRLELHQERVGIACQPVLGLQNRDEWS